jgi:pyridoxal phosphate enzyme (YggS family)
VDTIRDRFEKISERIYQSAQSAGRDPDSVRLVVVTKLQPVTVVYEVVSAGARYLGENYVEEALEKKLALADLLTEKPEPIEKKILAQKKLINPSDIQWHIIGHVQSRKARFVCEHFDYLHSLDSLKLAQRLSNICTELRRELSVLLEFNVSGEQSKFGWPAWDETHWATLLSDLQQVVVLPNIHVNGLMTMPPFFENPEDAQPYFRLLRKLQGFLIKHVPQSDWQELSMGMSGDFEVAVQEGATWVRIGQAILGPRPG